MQKLWLRRKTYGWGWYPATWQGWLILGIFGVVVAFDFYRIDSHSHSVSDTLINFIPHTLILTLFLMGIGYFTGEKPRGQWGSQKE